MSRSQTDSELEQRASAEERRLAEDSARTRHWKRWGPYLSERQWGTVREDYSADGNCWDYFPHDHARSRAYRWGEDGLLGITDRECRLCFALALWNGRDPILKERLFGLTRPEGNHGEDVKECYYYLDSTPTHSYMKALYKYPQARISVRAAGRGEPPPRPGRARVRARPTRASSTSGRYFDVSAEYAKASPNDILIRITVANRGPEAAPLARAADALVSQHLVVGPQRRRLHAEAAHLGGGTRRVRWPSTPRSGAFRAARGAEAGRESASCSSPRTRRTPSASSAPRTRQPFVKDAFHELRRSHGANGRGESRREPAPRRRAHYRLEIPAGGERGRCACGSRRRGEAPARALRASFDQIFAERIARGRRVLRRALRRRTSTPRRRGRAPGLRRPAVDEAVLPLRRRGLARRRSRRSRHRRRSRGCAAATTTGRTSSTATSSRCPTSGSIPGTPPGISRST